MPACGVGVGSGGLGSGRVALLEAGRDTEIGGKAQSMSSGLIGNEEASVLPLLFSQ